MSAPAADFATINKIALRQLQTLVSKWLPNGERKGEEYIAINPRRADKRRGSFKVNVQTGKWADFATGDRGGDPISLRTYLIGSINQGTGARDLAAEIGFDMGDGGPRRALTPPPVKARPPEPKLVNRKQERARELWKESSTRITGRGLSPE